MDREEEIRLIAYSIWEQESCPNGKDCEHWFRAEAIWEEQEKVKKAPANAKKPTGQSTEKATKPTAGKKKK